MAGLKAGGKETDKAVEHKRRLAKIWKEALAEVVERLQGRVAGRVVGISEQVADMVRQATSDTNLANMYEGWTAWI